MSVPEKIVCYDDNPDYGGHQVMACLAVEGLAQSAAWQPVLFCSPQNRRLNDRLVGMAERHRAQTHSIFNILIAINIPHVTTLAALDVRSIEFRELIVTFGIGMRATGYYLAISFFKGTRFNKTI